MKYLKAYLAGIAFPATLLPIMYLSLFFGGHSAMRAGDLILMPLLLPMLFGLWNGVYFMVLKSCPLKKEGSRLWAHGMILGLLVALIGVFIIGVPKILFGFTGILQYLPLIILPIIYGLIWRYVIAYLNQIVGLKNSI